METSRKLIVQADGEEINATLNRPFSIRELWDHFQRVGRRPSSVAINQQGEATIILANRRKVERGFVR